MQESEPPADKRQRLLCTSAATFVIISKRKDPDMEFEHKESLLQSGSSSHQESEIDHPFLPGLPPRL
eukprot:Em0469g3a